MKNLLESIRSLAGVLVLGRGRALRSDLSDDVWERMQKDSDAKEFVRVHSQILNGGMEQLFGNEREDWGAVKYLIRESSRFVRSHAPKSFSEFDQLMREYSRTAEDLSGWERKNRYGDATPLPDDIGDAWDETDSKYYKFYEAMETEIEASYAAGVTSSRLHSGRLLTSGLQKHVEEILEDAGVGRNKYDFDWTDVPGVTVSGRPDAEIVMKALDASGGIGPTRWNRKNKKVELGTHESMFRATTDAKTMTFDEYVKKFKNFEID